MMAARECIRMESFSNTESQNEADLRKERNHQNPTYR